MVGHLTLTQRAVVRSHLPQPSKNTLDLRYNLGSKDRTPPSRKVPSVFLNGNIAQPVEQRSHTPFVASSILAIATKTLDR